MTHRAVGYFEGPCEDRIDGKRVAARSAQLLETGVADITFEHPLISENRRQKILKAEFG